MMILLRGIKLANVATIQGPHDTDACEQRWPVKFCDQQLRFHRGLPLIGIVFRFFIVNRVRRDSRTRGVVYSRANL